MLKSSVEFVAGDVFQYRGLEFQKLKRFLPERLAEQGFEFSPLVFVGSDEVQTRVRHQLGEGIRFIL
jgi:hypothetical protein